MTNIESQKGSVIFYILLAVVLFAALGFAVSNMMRGGGGDSGNEKSGIYASEIMTYSRSIKEAVNMVRISNECKDTEISFERAPFDGSDTDYDNASSPADFSCHIFHVNGGGISNTEMQDDVFNTAYSGSTDFGNWLISGHNIVNGIGDNANSELILVLPFLKSSICNIITERIGQSSTVVTDADGVNITKFTGAYSSAATYDNVDNIVHGCINITGGADPLHYAFFTTLIAR